MEGVGYDRHSSHPRTVVLREDVLFMVEVFVCRSLFAEVHVFCLIYFPRGSGMPLP